MLLHIRLNVFQQLQTAALSKVNQNPTLRNNYIDIGGI